MTEPASSAVGIAAAWKLGLVHKVAALFGVGALGAWLMAAFDPPATRRGFFLQALVAGVVALLFTLPVLRYAAATWTWAKVEPGDVEGWLTLALPIGFLLGAMSWGLVGALVQLRRLVQERAAKAIGERVGLTD